MVVMFSVLICALPSISRAGDAEDFFERKIRPVLVKHCYQCHAADSKIIQGGLRLDHPAAMQQGGDSGNLIVSGDPDASLLVTALRYDDMEMPPSGKLDDQIIRDFETWISSGAVDPREHDPQLADLEPAGIDWDRAKEFWAFQRPHVHPTPLTIAKPKSKIDAFVLAQLESSGLRANAKADRPTLIRRVTFDLTGLPPTVDEVDAFVNDSRPGAFRRVVERLLSTTQHAERWTRMWLDVARYAEDQAHKVGNNDSLTYPNAYLYRDWVINAFAADRPYDDFIRTQLASDLIDGVDADSRHALGYMGLGPKYYRRSSPEVMADEWEDRVDTLTRGLLGLTVACARCHDHKFDPIPTSDYYALAGVFASTQMYNRPISDEVEKKNGAAKKPQDAEHLIRDGKPTDLNVLIRGDVNSKGPVAERGFLTVLCDDENAIRFRDRSGRAELADAIVSDENPLAARVMVNRVWRELMGRGLVETPSNFGQLGERPSHPELLDDLSVRFMQNGWSLKWLQREIVLSSTYQRSSQVDPVMAKSDPENRFYWRMLRRRLSVESYRDAVLLVTDHLDSTIGGKSIQPDDADASRRTLYSEVSRMDLNPMLARFDFPDPNAHSAKRVETNTPLQKLFLLNSPFLVQRADELAKRMQQFPGSHRSKIEHLYEQLYSPQANDRRGCLGRRVYWGRRI